MSKRIELPSKHAQAQPSSPGPWPSSPYKMRKVRVLAGKIVLDVGCRDGAYVAYCLDSGMPAIGVDLAPQVTGCARLPLVKASADALPFADGAFQTVLMFDVLEHVRDDVVALRAAARVARGNILLTVPKPSDPDVFNPSNGLTFRHYVDPEHKRYYEPEGIRALASATGLTARGIEHWCPVHPSDVYTGGGVSRFVCRILDRLMWAMTRNRPALLRNLFAEILLEGRDQ